MRDMKTGEETQITHTEGTTMAFGWCRFDNKIYFVCNKNGDHSKDYLVRLAMDGSTEQCLAGIEPNGRISWANTGAWIGGAAACPASR